MAKASDVSRATTIRSRISKIGAALGELATRWVGHVENDLPAFVPINIDRDKARRARHTKW